jgi:hypothetical protein
MDEAKLREVVTQGGFTRFRQTFMDALQHGIRSASVNVHNKNVYNKVIRVPLQFSLWRYL